MLGIIKKIEESTHYIWDGYHPGYVLVETTEQLIRRAKKVLKYKSSSSKVEDTLEDVRSKINHLQRVEKRNKLLDELCDIERRLSSAMKESNARYR